MSFGKLQGFIVKKLGIAILSIIAVIALITLIIYSAPIDATRIQFGQHADPKSIEIMRKKLYLDKSYGEQIFRYFEDLSPLQLVAGSDRRLDDYQYLKLVSFGNKSFILKKPYLRRSYANGEKVIDLIASAMPSTFILAFSAMFISMLLGLSLGCVSAIKYGTYIDHIISALITFFYAVPSYISAILFALLFGYYLHDWTGLPVQGSLYNLDDYGNEYFDISKLILPSIALGIRPIAMISQMTRASLLEIFTREYVRTASAMGLLYSRVFFKHIFPNALNPIITTISGWFASLLTGAFFVEYVFNYRGLGDLTIQALSQFDLPVILGSCIVTISVFIVVNILADVCYAIVDPRIRF
jgi:peptide/nickel transport system permease protein